MRRTLTIAAIAVLILVGFAKLVGVPHTVVAGDTSIHPTISTYDLQTRYSGVQHLPVAEIPQP
jgi:hypothetical protein